MSAQWTTTEQVPMTPEQERYIASVRMIAERLYSSSCPIQHSMTWDECVRFAAYILPTPEPEWHSHD